MNSDESTKVILTPDGTADDVSSELAEFLDYLAGKGGNSSFVKRLNEAVEQARNKEVWASRIVFHKENEVCYSA